MQDSLLFDICETRHGGNAHSVAANKRADKLADRQAIIEFLRAHGKGYSKEIARAMKKPLNALSGRFSELKRDNVIEIIPNVSAEGCAIYRLKD